MSLIRDDFAANAKTVNSRNITFGAVIASGTNAGTGTISRLTVDEDGFPIESIFFEKKQQKIIRDQATRARKDEEVFLFEGADRKKDNLELPGSGLSQEIRVFSARDSRALGLRNPSFSQRSGTDAIPTAITDWIPSTPGDVTNFELDSVNFFRGFPGDSLPRSIKFKDNDSLTQKFSVGNINLNQDIPVYIQLAWNSEVGAAVGAAAQIDFKVGSKTVSVLVSGVADWNVLRFPLDKDLWPKNLLGVQDPEVKITVTGMTGGFLLIDDIVFVNMILFDRTWVAPVGGRTPFLFDDKFEYTDALAATDGIIQKNLWIGYGISFPSNNVGAETFVDPVI